MDERGDILDRAIDSLRELPEVRPESTARLLIAVAAERQRQREATVRRASHPRRWLAWSGVAAAASIVAAFALLPGTRHNETIAAAREPEVARSAVPAVPASHTADEAGAMRAVQLVLSAPGARTVRVVGDFNGWDDRQSPMTRDEASGLWNVSLMLRPGRHVYAFVVNDTQWVRDPRAVPAPDADFGRPGSVLLVGRP